MDPYQCARTSLSLSTPVFPLEDAFDAAVLLVVAEYAGSPWQTAEIALRTMECPADKGTKAVVQGALRRLKRERMVERVLREWGKRSVSEANGAAMLRRFPQHPTAVKRWCELRAAGWTLWAEDPGEQALLLRSDGSTTVGTVLRCDMGWIRIALAGNDHDKWVAKDLLWAFVPPGLPPSPTRTSPP